MPMFNKQQQEFLDTYSATLKARSVASDVALMACLAEDPVWIQQVANRHERALDIRCMSLAKSIDGMDGLTPETEAALRKAAVSLMRKEYKRD